MPEIRIDPLSGRRTIVAGERSLRPGGARGCEPPQPIDPDEDPFAEGNEARTPPELFAVRPSGAANAPGWKVRVVPNLYPALEPPASAGPAPGGSGPPGGEGEEAQPRSARGMTRDDLFVSLAAVGAHEVIINGPQPVLSLAELPARAGPGGGRGVARAHARSP